MAHQVRRHGCVGRQAAQGPGHRACCRGRDPEQGRRYSTGEYLRCGPLKATCQAAARCRASIQGNRDTRMTSRMWLRPPNSQAIRWLGLRPIRAVPIALATEMRIKPGSDSCGQTNWTVLIEPDAKTRYVTNEPSVTTSAGRSASSTISARSISPSRRVATSGACAMDVLAMLRRMASVRAPISRLGSATAMACSMGFLQSRCKGSCRRARPRPARIINCSLSAIPGLERYAQVREARGLLALENRSSIGLMAAEEEKQHLGIVGGHRRGVNSA